MDDVNTDIYQLLAEDEIQFKGDIPKGYVLINQKFQQMPFNYRYVLINQKFQQMSFNNMFSTLCLTFDELIFFIL